MQIRFSCKMIWVVLCAALVLLPAAAGAASLSLRFTVPFAFTAGSQVLPSGHYDFLLNTETQLLTVRTADGTDGYLVPLFAGAPERNPQSIGKGLLRFEKIGTRHFLIGVWRRDAVEGHAVIPSPRLMELAKAEAGSGAASTYVNIQ